MLACAFVDLSSRFASDGRLPPPSDPSPEPPRWWGNARVLSLIKFGAIVLDFLCMVLAQHYPHVLAYRYFAPLPTAMLAVWFWVWAAYLSLPFSGQPLAPLVSDSLNCDGYVMAVFTLVALSVVVLSFAIR